METAKHHQVAARRSSSWFCWVVLSFRHQSKLSHTTGTHGWENRCLNLVCCCAWRYAGCGTACSTQSLLGTLWVCRPLNLLWALALCPAGKVPAQSPGSLRTVCAGQRHSSEQG